MLNEVLNTCEKLYQANKNSITKNKRSSDCILQIFITGTFKT